MKHLTKNNDITITDIRPDKRKKEMAETGARKILGKISTNKKKKIFHKLDMEINIIYVSKNVSINLLKNWKMMSHLFEDFKLK